MRKYAALGMIAAMALGAQAVSAQGFSYNLIEGSYVFGDVEGADFDGFGVKGSAELTPMLHAFGGLQNLSFDGGGDLDTLNLGLGVNFPMSDALDLVGGVSFERAKVGGFGSESGFGLNAGVRGRAGENFELAAGLKYADIGDYGDSFTYTAGVRWYFTPNFAVGADYNKVDLGDLDAHGDSWVVSLRYDFGSRQ
jgi:opacity protein-like surface antigen